MKVTWTESESVGNLTGVEMITWIVRRRRMQNADALCVIYDDSVNLKDKTIKGVKRSARRWNGSVNVDETRKRNSSSNGILECTDGKTGVDVRRKCHLKKKTGSLRESMKNPNEKTTWRALRQLTCTCKWKSDRCLLEFVHLWRSRRCKMRCSFQVTQHPTCVCKMVFILSRTS